MLFDNKAVTSEVSHCIFETNNGFDFADLKVEIYEYCTVLCYFKEKFRISV